jgi:UDP-N-acetylglucosamine kinase
MSFEDKRLWKVTEEEFRRAFSIVRDTLLSEPVKRDHCAVLLGGQPGAGKSTLYRKRPDLRDYAIINGDSLRYYHPRCHEIGSADPSSFVAATKEFCGKMMETLIAELSLEGYNLVIEGTFRTIEIPVSTARHLASLEYQTEISVLACDAELAWRSNLTRAVLQKDSGLYPRLLPLPLYDRIVTNLPEHLLSILQADRMSLFTSLSMYNRRGESVLLPGDNPAGVLRKELDLSHWRAVYPIYEREYPSFYRDVFGKELSYDGMER